MLTCVPSRVHLYCVYVCMCACQKHAQTHYWLDLGTWNHGSLSFISLLDSATFDTFIPDLSAYISV